MQLDGLAAYRNGRLEVALPATDQDFRARERWQQRVGLAAAAENVERLIEPATRAVQYAEAHIRRSQRRFFLERPQELGLRLGVAPLEYAQTKGAVTAQLGAKAAEDRRLFVRFEKARIHLERWPNPKNRQRQVRGRETLERAEIRWTLPDGALETLDRALTAGPRPLAPEMPSLTDELVGLRHLERIPELGAVDNPAAVLAETFSDVGECHVDGVARHMSAFPRLRHHRLVADELAVMLQQHAQAVERPQPEPDLDALTRQTGRAGVEQERAEGVLHWGRLWCRFLTVFCAAHTRCLACTIAPRQSTGEVHFMRVCPTGSILREKTVR